MNAHHHTHDDHAGSGGAEPHAGAAGPVPSLNRIAFSATVHCLSGCAIGEVLGMVIGTALGWSNLATIVLAVVLAFAFGYALTMLPLLRAGPAFGSALGLAFASDTISIATMEVVDNLIMLVIPGAMEAPLSSPLFWASLAAALLIAGAFLPGQPLADQPRARPRRDPRPPWGPLRGAELGHRAHRSP